MHRAVSLIRTGRAVPVPCELLWMQDQFEVFHGLTDGLGALRFASRLTEHYLELVKIADCGAGAGVFAAPGGRLSATLPETAASAL